MFSSIPSEDLLKKSLKQGGEFAELFFEKSRKTTIICEDKKIESVTSGIDSGVGLRLIANQKTAYGFSNDLSSSSLNQLVTQITTQGNQEQSQPDINLKQKQPRQLFTIKKPPAQIPLFQKIEMIQNAEKLAWSLDPRIVQVKIRYSDWDRHVEIANSLSEYTISPATLSVLSVSITISNGAEFFRGYESIGGHAGYEIFSDSVIHHVVKTAGRRAILNVSAAKALGGTMPVIISSQAGGTLVHEAVGHGLEADLACEGLSIYGEKLGEKVGSPQVTVVDDPTIPGKRGSYLFDDEGIPAQRTVLVEKGILKNYMHSRLTALKNNFSPNGHGRRESYAHRPIVRMSNTMIVPGAENPESIIRSVDKGLYVAMMGGGEVNTVNGDFVFEVSEGYRIEHGKIGEPVRGATLTGNGPQVLQMIDRVGNDIGFSIGTCGKDGQDAPVSDAMPTVRIPEMVVGGVIESQ